MFFHTQCQGLHAASNQKSIKGTQNGSCHILNTKETNLGYEFGRTANKAGNNVTVTVQILCRRVNNYIRSQCKRFRNVRCAEGIIYNDQATVHFMCNVGYGLNIYDF